MTLVIPTLLGIAVLTALAALVKAQRDKNRPPLDLSYKRYMRERLEWRARERLYGGMIGTFPDKDLWEGQQLNLYRAKYGKWPKETTK